MPTQTTDIALIAPEDDLGAARVADWLHRRGRAHLRVRSIPGSSLVLRVGDHTLWGALDGITRRLRDLLRRDLQAA